jgi:hypothetical protein
MGQHLLGSFGPAYGRKPHKAEKDSHDVVHRTLTLLGTCKLHHIEPLVYLRDVIARIPEHKANKLSELLPYNWQPLAK